MFQSLKHFKHFSQNIMILSYNFKCLKIHIKYLASRLIIFTIIKLKFVDTIFNKYVISRVHIKYPIMYLNIHYACGYLINI